MAGEGLLNRPVWGPGLLNQRPSFASMYPGVVAGEPLPGVVEPYSGAIVPFSRDRFGHVSFDPNAGIPGAIVRAVSFPAEAMAGRVDPRSDEWIGRALETAGMASTGVLGPAVRGGLGMGIRAYADPNRMFHGSRTGTIHPDAPEIYFSPDVRVATHYGHSGRVFEAVPHSGNARVIDFDDPPDSLIDAIMDDAGTGKLPQWLDDVAETGDRSQIVGALHIGDIVDSGGPLEDVDFVNWLWDRFEPDAVRGGGGGVIYNKDAFAWSEIDPDTTFNVGSLPIVNANAAEEAARRYDPNYRAVY